MVSEDPSFEDLFDAADMLVSGEVPTLLDGPNALRYAEKAITLPNGRTTVGRILLARTLRATGNIQRAREVLTSAVQDARSKTDLGSEKQLLEEIAELDSSAIAPPQEQP